MSCVEVDGAGWTWAHGLVRPVFKRNLNNRNHY